VTLAAWYAAYGRHDLAWRATRDRWAVLVSEVMLQQTQAPRVAVVWSDFMTRFPTPEAMADAAAGEVIAAWGTLGFPRRAKRLWDAAAVIARDGWPADLASLPGVGAYTAGAIAAQVDDVDAPVVEVNIHRVVERVHGRGLGAVAAGRLALDLGEPLRGRDRFLALMDVGATVCTKRAPRCDACPLFDTCETRGVLPGERITTQPRYEGSFRQRRGRVLAALRRGPQTVTDLDADALASLTTDGLAVVAGTTARLP